MREISLLKILKLKSRQEMVNPQLLAPSNQSISNRVKARELKESSDQQRLRTEKTRSLLNTLASDTLVVTCLDSFSTNTRLITSSSVMISHNGEL